jgi:hypothetical protein
MKQIYLVIESEAVRVFYSEDELHAAGLSAADKIVTEEEYNSSGCYTRIIDDEIIVGMTEAEKAAQEKNEKIAEIKAQLAEIDQLDGPRPIREAVSQMAAGNDLDTSHLMKHESEAVSLRQQLAAIMVA